MEMFIKGNWEDSSNDNDAVSWIWIVCIWCQPNQI